jgi:formylmethanofuran dehydrogenase subunit E
MCVGQVLGVRMVMAGLSSLGIDEPFDTKDLLVYVEVDRCLADAVQATTGCTIGKRRLKFVNYGKFGATFVQPSDERGVRVSVREAARSLARKYAEERGLLEAGEQPQRGRWMDIMSDIYSTMKEEELLDVQRVRVPLSESDLPGLPKHMVPCDECGELIYDHREVIRDDRTLCKACADDRYYEPLQETRDESERK